MPQLNVLNPGSGSNPGFLLIRVQVAEQNTKMELPALAIPFLYFAPRPGLEPGTIALTGRRSTIELSRNDLPKY
jgi:hypothetical protein